MASIRYVFWMMMFITIQLYREWSEEYVDEYIYKSHNI